MNVHFLPLGNVGKKACSPAWEVPLALTFFLLSKCERRALRLRTLPQNTPEPIHQAAGQPLPQSNPAIKASLNGTSIPPYQFIHLCVPNPIESKTNLPKKPPTNLPTYQYPLHFTPSTPHEPAPLTPTPTPLQSTAQANRQPSNQSSQLSTPQPTHQALLNPTMPPSPINPPNPPVSASGPSAMASALSCSEGARFGPTGYTNSKPSGMLPLDPCRSLDGCPLAPLILPCVLGSG